MVKQIYSYTQAKRNLLVRIRQAILLVFLVILFGTAGYIYIEGWSFTDSVYMSVITLTTIGLGEVHPLDVVGRWFTILLSLAGVGTVAYAFSTVASMILDSEIFLILKFNRMKKNIKNLSGHYIICGVGQSGARTMQELILNGNSVVVIERDPEICKNIIDENIFVVQGDATDEQTLIDSNIKSAAGLITTLPIDAENVYVTLSVREFSSKITIIARASDNSIKKKLLRAGASQVAVVDEVSGRHMANMILFPNAIKLINEITGLSNRTISLREISITENCEWAHKTPAELDIRAKTGLSIVGIIAPNQELTISPSPSTPMLPGSIMLVYGPTAKAQEIVDKFSAECC